MKIEIRFCGELICSCENCPWEGNFNNNCFVFCEVKCMQQESRYKDMSVFDRTNREVFGRRIDIDLPKLDKYGLQTLLYYAAACHKKYGVQK